jgi:methylmalonyl-CoA mutase N-terminal domain/subunit
MYRERLWTMRQYSGFGSAAESNARYKYLLSQGSTGISVAFDLPTQLGLDSDHPLAAGEVGRTGVAISTLDNMRALFEDLPLEKISTSMTINATAHILLGFYLVLAEERKTPWTELRGTIQNDVLKEYIARGNYIYPPQHALRLVTDIIQYCGSEVPQWNTISISGYHIREAGSTAEEEIGLTLADAICYVENVLARGVAIDDFAPRLAFFFNSHNNLLEEVAKFRAARRLWAKIMRERFNAKSDRSCMLRFHTQTAGSSLTAQQPMNNIVRTTVQALAAVMGGTQSLHTNAFDEALALPTKESALLALRTQQLLAHESGITDFPDPFGGSYIVEELTDRLEAGARSIIEEIDSLGGMVRAIEANYPQSRIEESAYRYQRSIEEMERKIVGVNCLKDSDSDGVPLLHRIDEVSVKQQIEAVTKYRSDRKSSKVDTAMEKLRLAAGSDANMMAEVVQAIRQGLTLGEISQALEGVWGRIS